MNGKKLKEAVWDSGIKIKELSEKSGIPEQTIYALYRKKEVDEYYLKKLSAAGVGNLIPGNYKNLEDTKTIIQEGTDPNYINIIVRMADSLIKDNELFRNILTKAIDHDAILINAAAIGLTRKELEKT